MPVISIFLGIKIMMYYDDHNPPHFHASYAGFDALIDIRRGCVMSVPCLADSSSSCFAWAELHKDELMQNWELAAADQELNQIVPLA